MRQVLEVAGFIGALLFVAGTIVSAVRSIVLPRAAQTRVPALTVRMVRAAFRLRAKRLGSYEERDRIMAMLAPIALLTTLATWLLMIIASYAVMFFTLTGRSWRGSLELSGSSVFTLGTSSDPRLFPSVLTYTEAALGLLIVALFITYFPSIYNAFSRRETAVALLEVRAGNPPQATTMLIRYHRIEGPRYELTDFWKQWETWFTDIEESHTTFPILVFFRSPQPHRSWITAAGALLDTASFWAACVDHAIDADVQLCLRAGFLSLRRIAVAFSIPFDDDPTPDGPISVSRSEWDVAMNEMVAAGVPMWPDREKCWQDWRGWRVNYDAVLLRLARLVEAPPAPWVSDRSPTWGPAPSGRGASGSKARRRRWRR